MKLRYQLLVKERIEVSKIRTAIKHNTKRSKRLVNLKEFLSGQNLRIEEEAGFKAYVKYKQYMSLENWNIKLSEYLSR